MQQNFEYYGEHKYNNIFIHLNIFIYLNYKLWKFSKSKQFRFESEFIIPILFAKRNEKRKELI